LNISIVVKRDMITTLLHLFHTEIQ